MEANTLFRLVLVFDYCIIGFDKTFNYIFQTGLMKRLKLVNDGGTVGIGYLISYYTPHTFHCMKMSAVALFNANGMFDVVQVLIRV